MYTQTICVSSTRVWMYVSFTASRTLLILSLMDVKEHNTTEYVSYSAIVLSPAMDLNARGGFSYKLDHAKLRLVQGPLLM